MMMRYLRLFTVLAAISFGTAAHGAAAAVATPETTPAAAYIQMLALHPMEPEVLYAATRGAGLFRRHGWDGTWQPVAPDVEGRHYNVVTPVPGQPGHILTGGENTGLWLSEDRGDNWTALGPLDPDTGDGESTILDLALSPDEQLFVLTPEGVYRSHNFRDPHSWQLVFDYQAWLELHRQPDWPEEDWRFIRFQKIAIDPHRPETILLGARWEGGYHRSDDGGDTWTHYDLSGIFRRVDELHVDPFQPQRFYAFTHHQGVFVSENRGQSWTVAGRGILPQIRTPYYGVYLLGGVALSQIQPGLLFSGSDYSTWRSENYGQSWTEVDRTLTCEFVRTIALCSENPEIVYAGSNVGVFQSRDGGASWEPANRGFPTREVLQTLDIEIEGSRYRYALVRGTPAVYRRSLDKPASQFHPLGWLLYESGESLRYDEETRTLTLSTPKGDIHSRDGGFRWDLPEVHFADLPLHDATGYLPVEDGGPNVIITGAPVPDDRPLLAYYQRPPFVSLQLVSPQYPGDGSSPVWSAHWNRRLVGSLQPPSQFDHLPLDLYIEVRDFQEGTRVGRAPFRGSDARTQVEVTPVHR